MLTVKKDYTRKKDAELHSIRAKYEAEVEASKEEITDYEHRLTVLKADYVQLRDADKRYEDYERQIEKRLIGLREEMPEGDIRTLKGDDLLLARRIQDQIQKLETEGLASADATLHETWQRVAPVLDRIKEYEEHLNGLRARAELAHYEIQRVDAEFRRRLPKVSGDE